MNAVSKVKSAPADAPRGLFALCKAWSALEARIDQLNNDRLAQRAPAAWRSAWAEESDALLEQQYALIAQAVATAAAHPDAIAAKVKLLQAFAIAHKPDFEELAGTRLDLICSIALDLARLGRHSA
jgi:hypothetical protein